MELDDLKAAWAELDRKLTATRAEVTRLHTARSKSTLRPLAWKLGWEVCEGATVVLLSALYLGNHPDELRFALPGVALLALGLLGLAAAVWQCELLRRIDQSAPVVDIQTRLAELRAFRLRVWLGVMFLCPLMWVLGGIVLFKVAGVDVYTAFGWPWVAANFAFGVVFLGVAVWAAQALAARFRGSWWLTRLADGLTGRSLARAAEQARQAAEFAAG